MTAADVFAVFALWFGGMGAILLGSYGIAVWWQKRRERLNAPIPYLPVTDDDLMRLADAVQDGQWTSRDDVMFRLACRHRDGAA